MMPGLIAGIQRYGPDVGHYIAGYSAGTPYTQLPRRVYWGDLGGAKAREYQDLMYRLTLNPDNWEAATKLGQFLAKPYITQQRVLHAARTALAQAPGMGGIGSAYGGYATPIGQKYAPALGQFAYHAMIGVEKPVSPKARAAIIAEGTDASAAIARRNLMETVWDAYRRGIRGAPLAALRRREAEAQALRNIAIRRRAAIEAAEQDWAARMGGAGLLLSTMRAFPSPVADWKPSLPPYVQIGPTPW